MTQSVKRRTLPRVVILWFVGSSPTLGSVLAAWSLEPASDSLSPSLSAPPPLALCLCISQKQINVKKKILVSIVWSFFIPNPSCGEEEGCVVFVFVFNFHSLVKE